jgi:hypothetical protein
MPWNVDDLGGAFLRLAAGPVDDDNRWPHCRHCDDDEYPCAVLVHDEPCLTCQATPPQVDR